MGSPSSEVHLSPATGSSAKVIITLKEAQRLTTKEILVDERIECVTQVQVKCPRHQREMRKASVAMAQGLRREERWV